MSVCEALLLWLRAMVAGVSVGAGFMFTLWALARLGLLLEEKR